MRAVTVLPVLIYNSYDCLLMLHCKIWHLKPCIDEKISWLNIHIGISLVDCFLNRFANVSGKLKSNFVGKITMAKEMTPGQFYKITFKLKGENFHL